MEKLQKREVSVHSLNFAYSSKNSWKEVTEEVNVALLCHDLCMNFMTSRSQFSQFEDFMTHVSIIFAM